MPKTKKQETEKKVEKVTLKKETKKHTYYEAVGRRKEATANVRLYVISEGELAMGGYNVKKGDILVNKRPIEKYFAGEVFKKIYSEPFRVTNTVGRFAVTAVTVGGGPNGQVGAFVHAVSRALEKVDKDKFRVILKKSGFLTRDSRMKERRKAGFAQKARARKQSPKR
ncbi:30S ribosomal protein S9 [Candidatus Gottesmanbacteria bacterium]|nr:30S ribosomal protein S9 [Candidatus Gottesmanbacteria bacterium]